MIIGFYEYKIILRAYIVITAESNSALTIAFIKIA